MKKLVFIFAAAGAILSSSFAEARGSSGDGVLFSLNTLYSTKKIENGAATTTDQKSTLMDINLGYQMSNGLYLGGLYITDSSESGSTKGTVTGYGPSLGYMKNGWFAHGHYILSAEYDDDTGTSGKWTKGTGMQADFGYIMMVSGPFHLGLEMSYRSMEYGTNINSAGVEDTSTKLKTTELVPKIRFTFLF